MASGTTLQSTPAKSIFVYRNGDTNFQCKKVVVNPRQVKNWDAFIELVTLRVKTKTGGAVRRVFTPTGRTAVSDLGAIENNHFYVAAGTEGFKRHQYNKIQTLTPQKTRLSTDPLDPAVKLPPIIKPVLHSRLKVSARCKRAAISVGSKVIYVFRNGDANNPAIKILFTKFMLKNYDVVLNEVTRKVNMMTGVVWKLLSLNGRELQGPEEIEDHEFYVAAGKEGFKKVPYPKDGVIVSPRITRPAQVRRRITRLSKASKESKASKDSKASKPAQTEQKTSKPSKPSKPTPPKIKKEKSPEQKEAEEVFHHKPTMVKRSRERDQQKESPLDYSEDPEGVFKAKEERNETKGAAEVQETGDTAIDLPIDQVAAEEVEEEEDLEPGRNEDTTQQQLNDSPKPPEEQEDMVGRMLEDDEVPEAIPDDAPPARDEDDNVVVNGGDDGRGDGGGSGDVDGTQEERPGGAQDEKKEEDQNEDQITGKITPIVNGANDDLPVPRPPSNDGAQSPNENNSNNAENRELPPDHDQPTGSSAPSLKQESLPPASPAKSSGRVDTPTVNNNRALSRKSSLQSREGQSRMSPHPPPSKRSVTPSPAGSRRRSVTPKEIVSNDVDSRPQSQSGVVADSAPSPQASPSPAVENNSPRPVSGNGQNVESSPTPHPQPSEQAPSSPVVDNGQSQSPVENNNLHPVTGDGQPPIEDNQNVEAAETPKPPELEEIMPSSPAVENGQTQSPVQNATSRPSSVDGQNVETTLEQNVPSSPPVENEQTQSPNQNGSPRPVSAGGQNVEGGTSTPHPPPSEQDLPPSPAAGNALAQSPIQNVSPRPASKDGPPESGDDQLTDQPATSPHSPVPQRDPTPPDNNESARSPIKDSDSRPQSAPASPEDKDNAAAEGATATPNPPSSEPNKPASPVGDTEPSQSPVNRNSPLESRGEQPVDDPSESKDNEESVPQKVVENAADPEPREGEVAA